MYVSYLIYVWTIIIDINIISIFLCASTYCYWYFNVFISFSSQMSWESEQARLRAMLEAVMSDNEDDVAVESDASIDDDYVQESDHDSMSIYVPKTYEVYLQFV